MRTCRTVEMREAPMHLAEDWFQLGVTRGLLLGMLYPWLAGFVSGLSEGVAVALGWALTFGLFGTLIGLLVGPISGGVVGLVALALDRRVTLRASPRSIAALAIATTAGVLTATALCLACSMGSGVDDGWIVAWLFLVVGPAALGLASLVVRPRIERPRALR